jgi:hypothetical protein
MNVDISSLGTNLAGMVSLHVLVLTLMFESRLGFQAARGNPSVVPLTNGRDIGCPSSRAPKIPASLPCVNDSSIPGVSYHLSKCLMNSLATGCLLGLDFENHKLDSTRHRPTCIAIQCISSISPPIIITTDVLVIEL